MFHIEVESINHITGGSYRYITHRRLDCDTQAIGIILRRSIEKRWPPLVQTVTAVNTSTGKPFVVWDNQKKDWVHGQRD